MKIIAMIPARLGSKRIPKKNLKLFDGRPLLEYPIELALNCPYISEVWVNSESELLGDLAVRNGAKYHKRPEELSTDTATNQQFTAEFLQRHDCDYVVMINSTSPLLRQETVDKFCEMLQAQEHDTVLSVIDEYAEIFFEDKPLNFSLETKINSQNLVPARKIVWALTAWKKEVFLGVDSQGGCGTFGGNIGLFTVPKDESSDLDTPEDWVIAEGIAVARKTISQILN